MLSAARKSGDKDSKLSGWRRATKAWVLAR